MRPSGKERSVLSVRCWGDALGEKLEYQLEYLNKMREPGRVLRRLKKSVLTFSHASKP